MGISRGTIQTGAHAGATVWSPAAAPPMVWSPAVAAILMLAAGAVSLAAKQPWLIASLGATALLQAHTPEDQSSRAYNVVVGHAIAIAAAFLAVALMDAAAAPSMLVAVKGKLPVVRVWASAMAIALTMLGQIPARAFHAPAAATTLLITLGIYRPTSKTAMAIITGVLIVAVIGEALRRARTNDRRWHPF